MVFSGLLGAAKPGVLFLVTGLHTGHVGLQMRVGDAAPPVSPIPGAPGCPNPMWTETITDVSFTSATLTVQQPPGTTVLTASCTFSPATSNGPVPNNTVTCTVS